MQTLKENFYTSKSIRNQRFFCSSTKLATVKLLSKAVKLNQPKEKCLGHETNCDPYNLNNFLFQGTINRD